MEIDTKADFVLMLLYEHSVKGITKLEKLLFLLREEGHFDELLKDKNNYFQYKSFRMGPFSHEVYDIMLFLINTKLVDIKSNNSFYNMDSFEYEEIQKESDLGDGYTEFNDEVNQVFFLTEKGIKIATELINGLSKEKKEYLKKLKKLYYNMPLILLLKYVYNKFPQYTTKSEIKGQVGVKF